jgi:hypothetical protein
MGAVLYHMGLPIIVLVIFAKGYWDIFSALV